MKNKVKINKEEKHRETKQNKGLVFSKDQLNL